jgi:hypothetical protein
MGKTESISSKSRKETRMSTLLAVIQYNVGLCNQSNKARERNERTTNRKGRNQIIPA